MVAVIVLQFEDVIDATQNAEYARVMLMLLDVRDWKIGTKSIPVTALKMPLLLSNGRQLGRCHLSVTTSVYSVRYFDIQGRVTKVFRHT